MLNDPITRRTVLTSLGATVALPWLESTNLFAKDETPTNISPKRFATLFFGDGVCNDEWTFSGQGKDIELGPSLKSLDPIKEKVNFINGIKHLGCLGSHSRGAAGMLTGVPPTRGPEIKCATSMDQVIAQKIGDQTQLSSLVLACERPISGFHESQYSMVYASHVSWSSPTSPVPAELYPSLAFDSLFASKGGKTHLSILDYVNDQLKDVQKKVSFSDKAKIEEYTTSIRDVETRLKKLEAMSKKQPTNVKSSMERPSDELPVTIDEHSTLMCDIIALAFQTDRTRIATLLLTNDLSGQIYPFLDIKSDHHSYSHNNKGQEFRKITKFWADRYAYLIKKLDAMPEGDGTVLDHSCIMMCNEHWYAHNDSKIPLLLAGGLGGKMKTGRTLDYEKARNRNMSGLLLNILDSMDVELPSFGRTKERLTGVI
jgi:hypothetical protein